MPKLEDLTERVERLLLRHDELKRTNVLLCEQLETIGRERDSLRSRLSAARGRIDTLLERLPREVSVGGAPARPGDSDPTERAA